MRIVKAGYRIMKPDVDDPTTAERIYKSIANTARTCYKSESGDNSSEKDIALIRRLITSGHEAMLEHESITVKFIVDRGISHELVRHRLASFAQESTRYCNYSKDKFNNEITVIRPCYLDDNASGKFNTWSRCMVDCENAYFMLLQQGCTPQEARGVLPTNLKTEVVMTMNLRELRHFLKLRAAGVTGKPHPQMLEVAVPLLNELKMKLPVFFEDIEPMEV